MLLKDIMRNNVPDRERYDTTVYCDDTISDLASEKAFFGKQSNVAVIDQEGDLKGTISGELLDFLIGKSGIVENSQIIDYFDEGVIIIDPDGRIFYINDMYSKIIGVPKYKIIGKYIQEIEEGSQLIKALERRMEIINPNVYIKSVKKNVSVKIHPIYIEGVFAGVFSIFKDVTEITNLNREVVQISKVTEDYKKKIEELKKEHRRDVIGESAVFRKALNKACVVAPTDATVLICGENGSGKEIIAKLIHSNSLRKEKPLVTVNCAAVPENLIESELFGYEEGAFTGTKKGGKIGKFEAADGGTLFLDEIGDMPVHMQVKLLRALQEGEIEKVGAVGNIPVNVRVIAATNQPLNELIEQKKFRKDLFYRLNVVRIDIPPLRERGQDVVLLAQYFLERYNKKYGKEVGFSREIGALFESYRWPGNVRELENVIESAVIMCNDNRIEKELLSMDLNYDINLKFEKFVDIGEGKGLKEKLCYIEKSIIERTLEECGGNRGQAAQKLRLNERTLYRKLKELNIGS